MTQNAVAPWVGTLEWVGEVSMGKGSNGNKWATVDFALKYEDHKMTEKYMTFNAFGEDKVAKITSLPLGTELKVLWWPETNHAKSNGKYYSKNTAIGIYVVPPTNKSAARKEDAGSYPQPVPPLPEYDGPGIDENDMPF